MKIYESLQEQQSAVNTIESNIEHAQVNVHEATHTIGHVSAMTRNLSWLCLFDGTVDVSFITVSLKKVPYHQK
jgi:t-SNARE complex subunit (syntaxin)